MSAFAVQSEPSEKAQSVFGTKDPILAATLGNFDFEAMHSLPVTLIVTASNVIDLVDKQTGRVEDCTHLEFRFVEEVEHLVFGRLSAHTVSLAHEIAKLAQKEQTKEISGRERLMLANMRAKWLGRGIGIHSGTLLWAVQLCYDQVTNFMVVSNVSQELKKNPLIEFSRRLARGTAYAIEPCESEPIAQRRSEKLFRK